MEFLKFKYQLIPKLQTFSSFTNENLSVFQILLVQKNTVKHAKFQNILNPTYGNCIKNITEIIFSATSIIINKIATDHLFTNFLEWNTI